MQNTIDREPGRDYGRVTRVRLNEDEWFRLRVAALGARQPLPDYIADAVRGRISPDTHQG